MVLLTGEQFYQQGIYSYFSWCKVVELKGK
jgi:hypothetical protein